MPSVAKGENHKKQRFHCANPNCNRDFSRPKIIKYYVCPTCQTLANIPAGENEEAPLRQQKHVRAVKPKKNVTDNKQEPITVLGIKTERNLVEPEGLNTQEVEREPREGLIEVEQVQTPQKKVIVAVPQQQISSEETKTVAASSSGCQFSFGYLSQRNKGEGIPDTCIECAKSLSCMLSEYYKKEENVKQIKKWYTF